MNSLTGILQHVHRRSGEKQTFNALSHSESMESMMLSKDVLGRFESPDRARSWRNEVEDKPVKVFWRNKTDAH